MASSTALEHTTAAINSELFSIQLDTDRYLIYAPLRRSAFIGNSSTVNLLASLKEGKATGTDGEGTAELLKFLRDLDVVDGGPEYCPVTEFRGKPRPTEVTLFMTTGCNLRCTYCYASAGDTTLKKMSLETACRGIYFVASNAAETPERHFEVAYHGGGEPTANWSVLTDSYGYAVERAELGDLTFSAATATNGVLRDDQIDWIVEHLNGGASVSFDGLPEVHDRNRLTISGEGSSDRVIHTLTRFDDAGYDYGIRVTVTRDLINLLPQSIEFIFSTFSPQRVQVEPAYQLGRWSNAPSAETQSFIDAYREAQQCARSFGREIHYSAARVDSLTNHFCGITQDSFALTPDGNVSACYEAFSEDNQFRDIFFYGEPDSKSSGYQFQLPVLDNLRQQSVDHREYCQGCFAKWHCAGDCYHKALAANGRGEFAGSERCYITRELVKDQLLSRIADSGGLFWHDPISGDVPQETYEDALP